MPHKLKGMNKGLSTLQFQSLSVDPQKASHLQGGTQDNGTFETDGSKAVWPQIIYGDGGQSGFNASDSHLRFNSFTGQFHDANFQDGAPTKWVIISAPIAGSPEGSYFYAPIIADPTAAFAGSIFQGSQSVWRTQDWGGNQAYLEANCPEFTTSGTQAGCGDFVQIGPTGNTDLTAASYGTRAGGFVARITRAAQNTGTMWVATGTGRVFITQNANACGLFGHVHPARLARDELAWAVRERHHGRSGQRQPRLDLVLGVQLQHPEPAGSRLLGDVQPRRWDGDVDESGRERRHRVPGLPGHGRRLRQPHG